ncbi:PadR family transcriptional regulator [Micromonospora sp. CPCC 205371]|nr:PadR family transcriptional regulator [Micromonospora sp. CPCC 205371]
MEPLERVGKATIDVLAVLLDSDQPRWGLEIIKLTGRPSGSVYPLLDRLERAGWVTSTWDDDSERRGPRRRMYRLTAEGAVAARSREQWQADVLGAADLGLSPFRLALGAVSASARMSHRKGTNAMLPIGPLALALRVVGGPRSRQRAAALAALSALALLGGVTMLLTG